MEGSDPEEIQPRGTTEAARLSAKSWDESDLQERPGQHAFEGREGFQGAVVLVYWHTQGNGRGLAAGTWMSG